MKQSIYIFSLYIGAVTFFTLSYFGRGKELSLAIAILVSLCAGIIVYAANRNEEKNHPVNA